MVLYMTLSLILFSFLTAQMSGPGVPRPPMGGCSPSSWAPVG